MRSSHGISRNMGREGSTYQKVAWAWSAMLAASGLSRQSQIMPITETSGSEAISAPKPGYRRATVDTTPMSTPEMEHFRMK